MKEGKKRQIKKKTLEDREQSGYCQKERHGVGAGKEERKEEYQESFLFHLDPYVTQTSQVLIEAK